MSTPLQSLFRIATISFAISVTSACGDNGTEATESASACSQGTLIAQCPAGSNPRFDAEARSSCEAAGEVDLVERNGSFTGSCEGSGECRVLCQFEIPCDCGVDVINSDGVVCTPCTEQAACGNGVCEGGEDVTSCPRDCAGACTPANERCNGNDRQICSQAGDWEQIACPDSQICAVSPDNPALTVCVRDGV
jgi:hypothetical protein